MARKKKKLSIPKAPDPTGIGFDVKETKLPLFETIQKPTSTRKRAGGKWLPSSKGDTFRMRRS